jgi:hypothetical protein
MNSDWFNGIEILQGRWQHGEKVGYCYPSRLEKTLCKWHVNVPLVTTGLMTVIFTIVADDSIPMEVFMFLFSFAFTSTLLGLINNLTYLFKNLRSETDEC